jgi:hypothetical protein
MSPADFDADAEAAQLALFPAPDALGTPDMFDAEAEEVAEDG